MHDALQIGKVGLYARNLVLVEHTAHTLDGILAGGCPYDELTYHGVVVDGDFIAVVHVAVNADTDSVRFRQLLDDTGRRHEVVFRIFGTDAALYSMTALEQVLLLEVQHLVVGNTDLLFHQVYAYHLFRDGVLHLQARIHFEEVEPTVLVYQKLDGTCTGVVYCLGCGNRLLSHLPAQFRRKEG